MYFLLISAIPMLACFVAFLCYCKKPYNFRFGILAAGLLVTIGIVVGCIFAFGPESEGLDTEIWNGRIASRYSEDVSCSHSYSCNCYTTCDDKGSCSEHCSTCYEHSYDRDWRATTTNQENIWFERVDRQGLETPARYSKAFVGEPTAIEHSFVNYFRLATHNVVANFYDGVPKASVPPYPTGFDLYRVNKLVDPDGILQSQRDNWLYLLNHLNSDLGAAKQVNIILLVTKQSDPRYEFNVQKNWIGGKKNDVILLVGAPQAPAIGWVRVITWSTNPAIKTGLRDDVTAIGSLDKRDLIIAAIRHHVLTEFQRIHMKDQKYLREAWEPSAGATFALMLVFALLAIGGCILIYFIGEDESCAQGS